MTDTATGERTQDPTGGDLVDVQLNGRAESVPANLSVQALLEFLELQPEMIVVERNHEILDKTAYGRVQVVAGDSIELVHFVGGG